jgi:hypothetical protein
LVLAVVDTDRYSDILVKRVGSVLLVQLVLNLFLKAIVEYLYKTLIVDLGLYCVLPKEYGVG